MRAVEAEALEEVAKGEGVTARGGAVAAMEAVRAPEVEATGAAEAATVGAPLAGVRNTHAPRPVACTCHSCSSNASRRFRLRTARK